MMCVKLVSPSLAGLPDRMIVAPGGQVAFVELKSEVGRLSKLQKIVIERMRALGAKVWVVNSREGVDEVIASLSARRD